MKEPTQAGAIIDISAVARPFRWVRLANYWMVVGCGTWLVGQLVNAPQVSREWWPSVAALWVALAVNVWAGLRTAGTIDRGLWARLYGSLPLLVVAGGITALSLYRGLPADIDQFSNPAGNALFVATVLTAGMAMAAACGLVAVWMLNRRVPTQPPQRLRDLIGTVESRRTPATTAERAMPISAAKGSLCMGAAAVILIGQHFVPDEVWQPRAQILSLLALSGWGFLFRGRRYFQPDAERLRVADRRPPVLFLRSFQDDERASYLGSEIAVIDFGIETRLAGHFLPFGPFVAIGAPGEPVPRPGVATTRLDDNEWQRVVIGWMADAQRIVLMAGTTKWVNWELGQVLRDGHHDKLIMMIPRPATWFGAGLGAGRRRDAAARLAAAGQELATTRWAGQLDAVARPQDLRAVIFNADGTLTQIVSRPRSRDAYHLAVIVAHDLLLRRETAVNATL